MASCDFCCCCTCGCLICQSPKMETRTRKRHHVVDFSSEDDFLDLDDNDSDDVMCSLPVNEEVLGDKSSYDDDILSEDSSSGGSGSRSFNKVLYQRCLKDYQRIKELKRKMTLALEA